MSIPITICDDSQFARNQVNRALPDDWDVTVHFACNGAEAIEAIEQGKAEVLFLDLTMPVMDGIDALEQIHAQDLHTAVIVISADIQPAVHERVKQLGALTFLQKPVDTNALIAVLHKHGIYSESVSQRAVTTHKIERNDWVAEMINVAMGNAADRLARTFGFEIKLTTPHQSELVRSDIQMLLATSENRAQQALITQGFIGAGISGECLLFVEEMDEQKVCDLMGLALGDADIGDALIDLAGILNGSLLHRFFTQLDTKFHIGPPIILHHQAHLNQVSPSKATRDKQLLAVEIGYRIESAAFSCTQIIIFTSDACSRFDTILRTL